MLCSEEHFFICDNNPGCHCDYYNRFYTFCLGSHCNLFLHEIYKQMIDHACEYRSVACQVYPCDDEAERYSADEEVYYIQRVNHKSCLIGSLDEDKGKMPTRPQCSENHRFPEPVHVCADGIFAISLPSHFLYDRCNGNGKECSRDSYSCKREIFRKRKLTEGLTESKGEQNGCHDDTRKLNYCYKYIFPFYFV